jgi:signal transduction histidine kinase
MLNGDLQVSSTLGEGSCFVLTLKPQITAISPAYTAQKKFSV